MTISAFAGFHYHHHFRLMYTQLEHKNQKAMHNEADLHCGVQVAQLSQRDRATGWVSYGQKWKTGTGRQYLLTL